MTIRLQRLLVALAACAAALPVPAHEVDCTRLTALAVRSPDGPGPLVDPGGLPSLAAPFGPRLFVDSYPALVAFEDRIHNLATEPSILTTVADALPSDPARVLSFGDALAGTIPVGGTLRRVHTVAVTSQKDCMEMFPQDPQEGAWCGGVRENALLVTTESNIASCRAHVVCAPQKAPPRPACEAPAWTGLLAVGPPGVTRAGGVAVGCDGSAWASTANAGPAADGPGGSLFRFDRAGLLAATRPVHLDRIHVDGAGALTGLAGNAIQRLDPTGALAWEVHLPDASSAPGDSGPPIVFAVDPTSSVFVAYRFAGDVVVKKLSPAGALVWSTVVGTTGDEYAAGIGVSDAGDVFVGGTTGGRANVFAARLDPAGTLLWIKVLSGPGSKLGLAIAVDPTGHIAVGGFTDAGLEGGSTVDRVQGLAAVWDATGALQWVQILRPTPSVVPGLDARTKIFTLAFDRTGALWAGGEVLDGGFGVPVPPLGEHHAFVVRWDRTGSLLWARQFAIGSRSTVIDLALDAAGFGVGLIDVRPALDATPPGNPFDASLVRLSPDGT